MDDPEMVLMTPRLKKITGTMQLNTTQFRALCFCVTRTLGNPVHGFIERLADRVEERSALRYIACFIMIYFVTIISAMLFLASFT